MDGKDLEITYGELVSRCWDDPDFKERFINDTKAVLVEAGLPVEENVEYKVVEAEQTDIYVVLPHVQVAETVRELTKMLLSMVETDEEIVPEGERVVILQNTEKLRHVILKKQPDVLSDAELDMVAGGRRRGGKNVNKVTNVNYAVHINVGAAVNAGAAVNYAAGVNVAAGAAFAVVAGAVIFI